MESVKIIGWLATIFTLSYTCLGLPVQILDNHKRKSTEGLSLFMICFMALTMLFWTLYGCLLNPRDWCIIVGNGPGFFFCLVVIWQFAAYRRGGNAEA